MDFEGARCRDLPPGAVDFFPEPHETGKIEAAVAVCAGCPARGECLAVGRQWNVGVWGGVYLQPARERPPRARAAGGGACSLCGRRSRYCRGLCSTCYSRERRNGGLVTSH